MLLVFIIVARYFGPEAYGAYNTAFSFVFLSGMLSKLGFEMAVIREGVQNPDKIDHIQNNIFPFRFWLSIITWGLSIFLAYLLNFEENTFKLILIMSPTILIGGAISSGVYEHFSTFFKIIERLKYVTIPLIIRTFVFSISALGLVFFESASIVNLSYFIVVSSLIGLFFQYKFAVSHYNHVFSIKLNFSFIKKFLRPILLFGLVSLIYELSLRMNILMLNKLGNNIEAGLYSAAWQLVSIGTLFISSFSTAIFPNSARHIFFKKFRMKALKGFVGGTICFVVICLFTPLLSELVINLFFGSEYEISARVLSIIIWFLPLRFLSLWGHQILESADFLVLRLIVFVIPMILNIVLNYIWIPEYGSIGAAYASLFSNIILLILAFASGLYCVKTSKKFEK